MFTSLLLKTVKRDALTTTRFSCFQQLFRLIILWGKVSNMKFLPCNSFIPSVEQQTERAAATFLRLAIITREAWSGVLKKKHTIRNYFCANRADERKRYVCCYFAYAFVLEKLQLVRRSDGFTPFFDPVLCTSPPTAPSNLLFIRESLTTFSW